MSQSKLSKKTELSISEELGSIQASIIADSLNSRTNDRIISVVLVLPRIVLAELNTHRVLSRNSASSRAIPTKKMIEQVRTNPFIPIAFQKDHKGMQGVQYFEDQQHRNFQHRWHSLATEAAQYAEKLMAFGCTKQLANRIMEPYMWHTVIITATEWTNFFDLRCPRYEDSDGNIYYSKKDFRKRVRKSKDIPTNLLGWLKINKSASEIHISQAAEAIWDAVHESVPKTLKTGEWHIPFGDNIDTRDLLPFMSKDYDVENPQLHVIAQKWKVKIATARCARVSYLNYEGKDDYKADIELYNNLSAMKHWSPFEHCARVMNSVKELSAFTLQQKGKPTQIGVSRNFRGFLQLRHLIDLRV